MYHIPGMRNNTRESALVAMGRVVLARVCRLQHQIMYICHEYRVIFNVILYDITYLSDMV